MKTELITVLNEGCSELIENYVYGLCSSSQVLIGRIAGRNPRNTLIIACLTIRDGTLTRPECIECITSSCEVMWDESTNGKDIG